MIEEDNLYQDDLHGDGHYLPSHVYDTEQQFILRLPEEHSILLAEMLRKKVSLNGALKITWLDKETRNCTIKFNDSILYGQLKDLPCIVESQKTLDNKSFYKSADISQILVAQVNPYENSGIKNDITIKGNNKDKNKQKNIYSFPDGLTPPMKNVRKRRFRKTAPKRFLELKDIENEVDLLLKEDANAVEVKFELVVEEENEDKIEEEEIDDDREEQRSASAAVTPATPHTPQPSVPGIISDLPTTPIVSITEPQPTADMDIDSNYSELNNAYEVDNNCNTLGGNYNNNTMDIDNNNNYNKNNDNENNNNHGMEILPVQISITSVVDNDNDNNNGESNYENSENDLSENGNKNDDSDNNLGLGSDNDSDDLDLSSDEEKSAASAMSDNYTNEYDNDRDYDNNNNNNEYNTNCELVTEAAEDDETNYPNTSSVDSRDEAGNPEENPEEYLEENPEMISYNVDDVMNDDNNVDATESEIKNLHYSQLPEYQNKLQEKGNVEAEIEVLKVKVDERQQKIDNTTNPVLKKRFMMSIVPVKKELEDKQSELITIDKTIQELMENNC